MGLVLYLLQSLQISPTIAGVVLYIVATWCAWPIETKEYANTIAAANNFIVNECLEYLQRIDLS